MSDMECLWTTGQHTVQTWMQNHEKKRKESMESIVVRRRNFSYVLPLFFFLKIVHPRPLFTLDYVYFKQTTIQQSNVEKCLSNIRCWDSISRPLEHHSPLITTRLIFRETKTGRKITQSQRQKNVRETFYSSQSPTRPTSAAPASSPARRQTLSSLK